ncbi:MAG: 1,4-beta-D-glucan glucohydrolase [Caulobacter sp.]|nr:1,4-beta-D-glucan glucohydrolase [Caulobacter sp.]
MTAKALASALMGATLLTAVVSLPVAAQAPARGVAHPALWPKAKSVGLVDAATEARVSALLAKMSLEEKVGQMVQADLSSIKPEDLRTYPIGSILAGGSSPPLGAPDRSPQGPWVDTVRAFRAVSDEARPGRTPIPLMFGIDAVHGNNNVVGATLFPHNIGLGAARDPAMMRRIGEATAQETAAAGFDWAFGPTLTVPRDDRWGRSYEGYSEDPRIVAAYAGQMVLGLQGAPGADHPLRAGHVAASAKHFLGDGATLDGVDQGDAQISEADLIRLHAPGYPPAIDAGTLTVMASFSGWQGVKMHGNRSLLTDVLKGRMGFDGFVVGDWNGHGQVPGCKPTDCAAAVNAGLDMFMAPDSWKGVYETTLAHVRSGEIPMARLDDAVRRILRVKVRLGLFDADRPWEGRAGVLGAPAHRALAREAVRKSLVLLKNDGVLPLKASARVLVAGSGADDIGRQSGGWTLSWQGTDNKNSDFPGAQSIYAGLKDAVTAAGGTAQLSVDGSFQQKPDVAVVVFGETPYAEGVGDLKTLEYQAGDKTDLALLKRLKAAGVPVVAVFLSGRPLWVNPELNASDAFVAAWLPGSEGGGVADVIVGDVAGKPRHDFHGKLSFSWPRSAAQTSLNVGDKPYDPLFAYGYGLTYKDKVTLPKLSEVSGVAVPTINTSNYFIDGKTPAPWRFARRPSQGATVTPVDAGGVQEAGRRLTFRGEGPATVALVGDKPLNLSFQTNADLALVVDYRVDAKPSAPVTLALGDGRVDATALLAAAPLGEWRSLKTSLKCFRDAGADVAKVTEPFALTTAGTLTLTLKTARLTTDPAGAVCPPKAP